MLKQQQKFRGDSPSDFIFSQCLAYSAFWRKSIFYMAQSALSKPRDIAKLTLKMPILTVFDRLVSAC
mgnify:CR=1 FL=1